jgi:hypothetical protein
MITATKKARERVRAARWMVMATKARATVARGMLMVTRVAGNKKGKGDCNEEGNGN